MQQQNLLAKRKQANSTVIVNTDRQTGRQTMSTQTCERKKNQADEIDSIFALLDVSCFKLFIAFHFQVPSVLPFAQVQ
jgi:hypothetical protein